MSTPKWKVIGRRQLPDTFVLFDGGGGVALHSYFGLVYEVTERRGQEIRTRTEYSEPVYVSAMSRESAALFRVASAALNALLLSATAQKTRTV